MKDLKDNALGLLVAILIVVMFVLIGTIDHDEEARHDRWLKQQYDAGEWVML